jgi:hypothetical protein
MLELSKTMTANRQRHALRIEPAAEAVSSKNPF